MTGAGPDEVASDTTAAAASPRENSYGFAKRLTFVAEVLRTKDCHDVLDVRCGTGNELTTPLALMFPSVSFTGVDTDQTSIAFAQQHNQGRPKRRARRARLRTLIGSTRIPPRGPMSSAGTIRGAADGVGRNTLASSPHINFFTRHELSLVFAAAGYTIEEFRPRTVLCGAGLDRCIRPGKVAEWNARLAIACPP